MSSGTREVLCMVFKNVKTQEDLHFQFSVERLQDSSPDGGAYIWALYLPQAKLQTTWGLSNVPGPGRVLITQRLGGHLAGFCAATSLWVITPGLDSGRCHPLGPTFLLFSSFFGLLKEPICV